MILFYCFLLFLVEIITFFVEFVFQVSNVLNLYPLLMVGGKQVVLKGHFSRLTPVDSLPDCNREQVESSY